MQYREATRDLVGTGVLSTIQVLAEPEPLRLWVVIECDLATGVGLYVTATDAPDSTHYITTLLQPGEKVVFSRTGDMPFSGAIYGTGFGGGIAGYRGGECYLERVG